MQAIAEDLEAVVKENQVMGHQLVKITAERDRWQADMGAAAERAQRAETLAHCRDSEASQLRREHEVSGQTPRQCVPQAKLCVWSEACGWLIHSVRAHRTVQTKDCGNLARMPANSPWKRRAICLRQTAQVCQVLYVVRYSHVGHICVLGAEGAAHGAQADGKEPRCPATRSGQLSG